ncbi:MAG: nitroreductase family protein [Bacillus subtilis]|nr:nitroreductase family protein [Bacillus subtilis]
MPSSPTTSVVDLVSHAVRHTPSAFDSQSQRAILLFGRNISNSGRSSSKRSGRSFPPPTSPKSEKKIQGFANGRGTVLFFDDTAVLAGLVQSYPLYEKNFRLWAEQQLGMLQSNVWVGLAEVGYGASLQHYNELIEADVAQVFDIPETWKLSAQMPFGKAAAEPKAEGLPAAREAFHRPEMNQKIPEPGEPVRDFLLQGVYSEACRPIADHAFDEDPEAGVERRPRASAVLRASSP